MSDVTNLPELLALYEKATKGDVWTYGVRYLCRLKDARYQTIAACPGDPDDPQWMADMEFVTELLNAFPALAAELAALRGDAERKLTKIAQVGNGVFHVGVSERLVIERAQRQYEYEQTPERQAIRKEQLENFRTAIDKQRGRT